MHPQAKGTRGAWWLALAVSTAWMLHPLQVSTVLYTVQRMTQLATLFTLLGLLSYVVGRKRQLSGSRGGAWFIALAFTLFFPLAAFSKENGLLFPLFAALIEGLFFRLQGDRNTRRFVLAVFALFLAVPAFAAATALLRLFDRWVLGGYTTRDFSLYQRALTEMRALVYYLYQLIIPIQKNMGFLHDRFYRLQRLAAAANHTGLAGPPQA